MTRDARLLNLEIFRKVCEIERLLGGKRAFVRKDVESDTSLFGGYERCCKIALGYLLPLEFAQAGAVLHESD